MKLAAIAITAALLGSCAAAAITSAIAADAQTNAGRWQNEYLRAADFSTQRLFPRRYAYDPRYARRYQPTYYARPVEYRPYGLVPFFFGLSFPYRTW
jgi:hypothetical protein